MKKKVYCYRCEAFDPIFEDPSDSLEDCKGFCHLEPQTLETEGSNWCFQGIEKEEDEPPKDWIEE